MKESILIAICALFLFSCDNSTTHKDAARSPLVEIPSHCKEGGEPNLFVSETNEVYLSWIEYLGGSEVALQYSKLQKGAWTAPITVASGDDWFVNWADFPSLVAYRDGGESLAAHWLQKSAEGTYDYDVHIAQSHDTGMTWSPSFVLHKDGISAEHGFVSLYPISEDQVFATWLDGRNTVGDDHEEEKDDHGHGHGGAMSLRAAVFDKEGNTLEDSEIDSRVCDCCQTSAAMTDEGMVVVYRDRSEEDTRDISIVRQVDGVWLEPKPVYNDNWTIHGCPVNGPVVKANGKQVVVAWFSMADETPQVNVAFSNDSGRNFSLPYRVDDGNPMGRVDLKFVSDTDIVVTWLEETEESAEIRMAKFSKEGRVGESLTVATSKNSRQSGFHRMVKLDDELLFAWTHVDSVTSVKTALVPMGVFE